MAFATLATKEQINYLALHNLLECVGTNTIRRLFDGFHPPATLHEHIKENELILRTIARINPTQRDKLFTSPPSSLTSGTFDLKLLMVMLKLSTKNMPRPAKGWDNLPLDSDRSVTANVVRVEYYRRKVSAKASQISVDDTTFNDLWHKISRALIELGADETVINRLKTGSKDPEEVKKDSAVRPGNHPGTDLVCKMIALPRGIALIINNKLFADNPVNGRLTPRHGSEEDVCKVKELFETLGFEVHKRD